VSALIFEHARTKVMTEKINLSLFYFSSATGMAISTVGATTR